MINELFGQAIVNLFVGVLVGIVEAWNKKVFFVLFVIGLIIVIVSYLVLGSAYSAEYPWWRTVFGIVFVAIGIFAGERIYKEAFNKW